MKKLLVGQINQRLEALPGHFDFITQPRISQAIGFLTAIEQSCVLLYDMGTGKTKIALDVFRYHRSLQLSTRLLVLVPTTVLVEGWNIEIGKHAHDLRALTDLTDANILAGHYDVVVMTYARFNRMMTTTVEKKKKKDGKEHEWKIDGAKARQLLALFTSVVFDESTALSNHRSLTFKVCRLFGESVSRIALTGTPMGRDPQHLWSQFFTIDYGETLGQTIGMFRAAFFTEKKRYWGGFDYQFRKAMTPQLHRMLSHNSIRYTIDECVDMPEKSFVPLKITFTQEQWAYYKKAVERARAIAMGTDGSMLELKDTFMSMRMLASGFAHIDGRYIDFAPNEKLDHLIQMIQTLGEKVVVFNVFVHSGDLIEQALKKAKIKVARIYSKTSDKPKQLRRFLEDEECQVFLGNVDSTAMGLNLQIARYCITFEPCHSPITRDQSVRRIWRPGQERQSIFYDMMVKNSVEEKLYHYLEEGRSLFEALIDGKDTLT